MRIKATLVLVSTLTLAFAIGACKKEGSKGGSKSAGPKTVTLEKLGISAEVPGDAELSDGIGGGGVMIQGTDLTMTIEDGAKKPADPDKAKEDASMYNPQNPKVDTLEDGFIMTFTNKGGMGTNHWLMGRRMIDGKAYWCSTTAPNATIVENAVKVCKSLKK